MFLIALAGKTLNHFGSPRSALTLQVSLSHNLLQVCPTLSQVRIQNAQVSEVRWYETHIYGRGNVLLR